MKKLALLPILLIISISYLGRDSKSVLFGDHANVLKTKEAGIFRIFMDKNGDFYPENTISNIDLKNKGKSQLRIWAEEYPNKFKEIASSYNLKNSNYSPSNFQILQDSIIENITKLINLDNSTFKTWIFHGYRKEIHKSVASNSDSLSIVDNAFGVTEINNYLSSNNLNENLSIEVYWDGNYIKKGNIFRYIRLALIFKNKGIPNAENCGYSLRKVFAKINSKDMNIITHSTSTHIASSLLFNTKNKYVYPTPNNNIKVLLLASASPGKKLFKHYYKRNTSINFEEKDNYSVMNAYNELDVALKKAGFVKILGNTSLGKNHHGESFKLDRYFDKKYPNSFYDHVHIDNISNFHYFHKYIGSVKVKKGLDFLFQ